MVFFVEVLCLGFRIILRNMSGQNYLLLTDILIGDEKTKLRLNVTQKRTLF